jgi:hypothetical protein
MRKCIKTRFNHSRRSKISFLKKVSGGLEVLVVWKYAQMHQNTFVTTPAGQKYFFFF